MQEYRDNNSHNTNLKKINNLYTQQTDLFLLAQNIQQQTSATVTLFNASDPDVTLGFHVCECVNNMPHVGTTEENYGAVGTSGLSFEGSPEYLNIQSR